MQPGDVQHEYHGHLKSYKFAQELEFYKLYIYGTVSKKFLSFTNKFTI